MKYFFTVLFANAVIICFLTSTTAISVLDLLSWDLLPDEVANVEKRDDSASTDNPQSCLCDGPSCVCCVDFNLTFIDLGGPGCVQMKYISQDEGIAMNVSYGESLLHSEHVKGPNPEPTCMSMLADLAQICARFTDLYPTDDGLRGCLALEPRLLGETQTQFDIGCFQMGVDGMKLDTSVANNTIETAQTGADEENEEEIIAAVNESAAESFAFFGNLLGLNFGKTKQNNTSTDETGTEESTEENRTLDTEAPEAARSSNLQPQRIFNTASNVV